jgi:putative DNA primase/helicase
MIEAIDYELIEDLEGTVRKYVYLPSDEHYRILALYIVHTWCFDAAHVTPYLFLYSSKPGSGKTRLLEVLSGLCRNAHRAEDMTAPIMFKLIERECPTLLLDEVDTIWSGSRNEEKRRILNTGYKDGGCAWRQVARSLERYSTFSPKVLAGLRNGMLPATIYDRSLPIGMDRKPKEVKLERFIESEFSSSGEVDALLERIFQFKDQHLVTLTYQLPEPLGTLSDRQNEISEPLLQIASVFGIEQETRDALEAIFADENGLSSMSPEATLLMRIRNAFGQSEKAHTDVLLRAMPGFNGRTLALNLEKFGIAPRDVRMGAKVARGYQLADFAAAFEQYLPVVHEAEQITADAVDESQS